MIAPAEHSENAGKGWRLKFGMIVFVASIVLPVVGIPMVTITGLSAKVVSSISAALLVFSEITGIAAIAIMGKDGYAFFKSRVSRLFKQYGPPQRVSRFRYRVGLSMFSGMILFGWLSPYLAGWVPLLNESAFYLALIGDSIFVASFFVLGGEFWDKIRSLFIYDSKSLFETSAG